MDCPYIIRETIDADHVREHGYYQLDELVYDLVNDFKDADVEVITRPTYNVIMESGEKLFKVDDETVFKMLSAGLPIKYIENARDGDIMYARPEYKPAVKVKAKVGGITRANKSAEASRQYETPLIIPDADKWVVMGRFDDRIRRSMPTDSTSLSNMWFERKVGIICDGEPLYDEVRLYNNGVVVRAAVMGHEITL